MWNGSIYKFNFLFEYDYVMTHRQLICPLIYTDQLFQISNIFNIPVELLDGCRDPREVLKVISFTEFYLINKFISRMWAGFLNSQNTAGPSKKWKFDRICKNRKPDFLETTFISQARQTNGAGTSTFSIFFK